MSVNTGIDIVLVLQPGRSENLKITAALEAKENQKRYFKDTQMASKHKKKKLFVP